jgi:hypothetical protein
MMPATLPDETPKDSPDHGISHQDDNGHVKRIHRFPHQMVLFHHSTAPAAPRLSDADPVASVDAK